MVARTILAPVALLIAATFAATHVPPAAWPEDYGLGGLLGDAALGALLSLSPLSVTLSLQIATLALAVGFVLSAGYVLGVTWAEFTGFVRFSRRARSCSTPARTGLTGKAASGAAEVRGSRGHGRPSVAPPRGRAGGCLRTALQSRGARDGDSVMAKITAAVRARNEAEAAPRPLAQRAIPPLTAAVGDIDVIEREPVAELAGPVDSAAAAPEPRVQQPPRRTLTKSVRAQLEEQPELALDPDGGEGFVMPALSLLQNPSTIVRHHLSSDALEENARMLESVLDDYGVRGEIVSIRPGPVVTMYELEPAAGLKASRVIGLSDDIARSMSALACRCSTIPGRSVIGIELPNELREKVLLREILAAKAYGDTGHALPLALGKDIGGEPVVANLARMPHLLIAGTTGSGKSVAINTMILSLLYKLTPDECRLIMIDPKMLELSVYDGIPHLLSPVVTDPKKAVVALKWVVAEMEERYRKMSKMGVRNIDGYNARVKDAQEKGEAFTRTVQTGFDEETGEPVFETEEFHPQSMPFIVVIVDEMADLMMVAGKEIEACIQRLAQMARASGIHLIMATQRRAAARPGRHALHGRGRADHPRAWAFRVGRGGRGGGQAPETPRLSAIRGQHRRRAGPGGRERDRSGARARRRAERRCALRPGGGNRREGPQVLDLVHPAQARGRLQQGREARRADGRPRRRQSRQPCRQA